MKQKILSLLVLLMTAASGAWATSDISRALLSVPNSWEKDQNVFLTAEELPGFKAVTEEEAANWVPTAEDIENGAFLIYGFDAEGNMLSYATLMGAPAAKMDPGKMPHNNMYGLSHGSMLQVRFYYTSDVTLVGDKTEASFQIPQYDVTATYTIKRDMTVDVAGEMADRIRIQMVDNAFQAVDATQMNPVVKDNLETNSPVTLTVTTDYTLQLQKQSETNADEWTDATALSVGTFRYKITGAGNYSGICYSEEFALFQGYEVTVPAGEYVTYYKDEPLYADPQSSTDAKLYTISSVSATDGTATLSDAIATAPSSTPLLVYNAGNTDATFLLIPADAEPNLALTVAPEFIGTTEATTIAASTSTKNNYALNGKQFVWVKDAIAIAANKAWLEIGSGELQARTIVIVSGDSEATGIEAIDNGQLTIDNWYDLNGRRLQGKPTKKGIYIQNGKKVVVK